jgi:hypothetical protein
MPILIENTIIIAYYKVTKIFQCDSLHEWELCNGILIDKTTNTELKETQPQQQPPPPTTPATTPITSNIDYESNEYNEYNEMKYDYPETYKRPVETRVNLTQLCSPKDILEFGDVEMINDNTYKIYPSKYGKYNDKLISTNIINISNGPTTTIEATYKVKRYYAVPHYINMKKSYIKWQIRSNRLWIRFSE